MVSRYPQMPINTASMFGYPQQAVNATKFPWGDTALGLGIGLLTGRNWGDGAGQGLLYANQFAGQRAQREREAAHDAMIKAQFDAEQQQRATTQAEKDKLAKGYSGFIARMFDADPSNDIPGVTPQAAMFLRDLPPEQGYQALAPLVFPKAAGQPSSVEEYKFAQSQGYKGTYEQWQTAQKKAGASSINSTIYNKDYGDIPPGYRLVETPTGAEMQIVPGSPAAQAAETKKATQVQNTDVVTTDINRALEKIKGAVIPTTGIVGTFAKNLPNTNAYDVSALIGTVKANASIDKLQAMRQSSPTGGALGNVTQQENQMLADTIGALDQSQSREQLEYNLKRVYNTYLDIVHGPGAGPERYSLDKPSGPSGTQPNRIKVDENGNVIP